MTPSDVQNPVGPDAPALAIAGEFNIFTAMDTKARILDAISNTPYTPEGEIGIDLSQVTDIDSAGLQLMVMARREALRQGKRVQFLRCSETVADIVALCDMADYLGISA